MVSDSNVAQPGGFGEGNMENVRVPISDWDGQLPPHIAKNERIWWEVFPRIKPRLPSKIVRFFGGAKQSPSRETIGKVVLIAKTKDWLRSLFGTTGASLLNHWDCYCLQRQESEMVYMAGTATEPSLIFQGSVTELALAPAIRFAGSKDLSKADISEVFLQKHIESMKELGEETNLEESEISVLKFRHGSWENGLDITFKAAIWLESNREEALASIWKIQAYQSDQMKELRKKQKKIALELRQNDIARGRRPAPWE